MAGYGHRGWRGSTDGTPWMQRALVKMLRFIPVWVGYGIMGLVIPFYMLFDRKAFRASYKFHHDRIGQGKVASFFGVYSSEFHLGQVVLDRFSMYAGKKFHVDIEGYDLFTDLAAKQGGFMLLSSHVGNYELAGYTLVAETKKIKALVFKETKTVMSNRARMFSKTNIEMVPVSEDMSHIFTLNTALSDGDIVSMTADRVFGSQKAFPLGFLGEEARFPAGPFLLAVQKSVPVLSVFVMKSGIRRYRIIVRTVGDGDYSGGRIADEAKILSSTFVGQMEETVREYPEQWYNFFDFWKQ